MYKTIRLLLFGLLAVVIGIYWFRIGGPQTVILRNSAYLLFPFIATLSGLFALKMYGLKGSRTSLVLALTLGILGLLIGETIFYLYEFVFHINPFPSLADAFFLIAYPLFLFALVSEIRQTKIRWKQIRISTKFLMALVSIVTAILVFYFGVYLAYDPKEVLFTNLVAMAYGVGDLLLIVVNLGILVLAWEFRGGKFASLWARLFASFAFMMVADILFAIYNLQYQAEVWFYKSLIDTLFMVSYVFFADGLLVFSFSIQNAKNRLLKAVSVK